MKKAVLIIGESGTGKSTSIRTLPPEETFIINILDKPLPFRGSQKQYTNLSEDGLTGNYYAPSSRKSLLKTIDLVNLYRPEIKYLIVDDFGYTITNQFMRSALEKGYDKFSKLAVNAWELLNILTSLRDDLIVFIMMHSDIDKQGKSKPKTIGKMLDDHVCIEGKFSIVLHSICEDGNYGFLTNNNGLYMAKSLMGMFNQPIIENNLKFVADNINEYLMGEKNV
jgi:hypothetical protein